MSRMGIVLLAAGASRRLGRPKQLLEFQGRTLLRRMTELAVALDEGPVAVVLGARGEQMKAELEGLEVRVVQNPDWAEGMSTSLRVGIDFIASLEPPVESVLILLVDQPRVEEGLLRRLIAAFRAGHPPVVASFYNGMHGVPAIFDRAVWPELRSVSGDRGARRVIRRYEEELVSIDFPGGADDVDTEADWRQFG